MVKFTIAYENKDYNKLVVYAHKYYEDGSCVHTVAEGKYINELKKDGYTIDRIRKLTDYNKEQIEMMEAITKIIKKNK